MSCQDLTTCKVQLFSIEMDAGIKIIKHKTINSPVTLLCSGSYFFYFIALINQK
jgi:hypothetical protein